jgi:hypothetical protein
MTNDNILKLAAQTGFISQSDYNSLTNRYKLLANDAIANGLYRIAASSTQSSGNSSGSDDDDEIQGMMSMCRPRP